MKVFKKETVDKVIEWGKSKGFVKEENAYKQSIKLIEELGELAAATLRNDEALAKDAIGDMVVVTILLCEMLGYDFDAMIDEDEDDVTFGFLAYSVGNLCDEVCDNDDMYTSIQCTMSRLIRYTNKTLRYSIDECLELAYNEIKGREGMTIKGVFIKQSDLNLCDSCKFCIHTCNKESDQAIVFGDGVGNDNVIQCAWYEEDDSES